MSRILVIEDDDEVREMIERVLSQSGHNVVGASNGKEGVALFQQRQADLVITDIIMPEKDGIETIIDLKRSNPSLKVIAISGGGRAEPENYLHSATLIGANLTLKKPFTNEEMLLAVQDLLD